MEFLGLLRIASTGESSISMVCGAWTILKRDFWSAGRSARESADARTTSALEPGRVIVGAQRSELLYTLKNAFNNAVSPMLQCLLEARDLSEADLNELESMIKSRRNQKKK